MLEYNHLVEGYGGPSLHFAARDPPSTWIFAYLLMQPMSLRQTEEDTNTIILIMEEISYM